MKTIGMWLAACVTAGLVSGCAVDVGARGGAGDSLSARPMNQVQVIGSHNSFKRAPQPELADAMRPYWRDVDGIDYDHVSLTDQLNLGLRNLELDVCYDPEGGRYADPLGNRLLRGIGKEPWPLEGMEGLKKPGFKVLHDPDFDFRTWHTDFEGALAELRAWSAAHPKHEPIMVTMNCKQGSAGGGRTPGAVKLGAFDEAALAALNETVLEGLGRTRVLTPDEVRGDAATVREAVIGRGWPTMEEAAGKFFFVLDEGGTLRESYLKRFPGLRGAAYFTVMKPADAEAAIFVMNDPVKQEAEIRGLVERGFIVRTRADADTQEARTNDRSRFEAAKRSGAQVITTDYYVPDRKLGGRYVVRFEDGGFVRGNPVAGGGGVRR